MQEPIHILKEYWGHESFRPQQEDIIRTALSGADCLALLPTGGGKSICFQVPAMAMDGVCLVISPLIALMTDQVQNLRKRGITAAALTSALSKREIDIALDNAVHGGLKFLYLSPERIKTELFQARLKKMKISMVAIDEAHCISEWGHDFRPAYREIVELRSLLPQSTPFITLTATATSEVVDDIIDKLELKQMSASGETTLCKDKDGQCAAKKGAIRETMSITAPAEDGAKLLLSNWHNPTAADLGSYRSSLSIL